MTAPKTGDPIHRDSPEESPFGFLKLFFPPDSASPKANRARIFLLFALILLAYFPAYRGGFVFDDFIYVTDNDQVRDPYGLDDLWTSHSAYAYYPLTMTTFWVEYRLWGLSPIGYHVDNVLLHAGSAILFYLALRSLALRGALFAGFLFGLHPVCVESVAWISERKNVLSQFLVLLSVLLWLRYLEGSNKRNYLLSIVFFLLSLLAKVTTAPLPVLLLVIAWWKEGDAWRKRVVPLIPFFLTAFAIGSVCLWTERSVSEAYGPEYEIPFAARWIVAGKAFFFYLGKLLWPAELMAIYPRWEIDEPRLSSYLYPLTAVFLMVGLYVSRRKIGRGPFTVLALYLLALAPSLGFVNFAYMRLSFVADHFQYFACLAPIAGFAWLAGAALRTSGGTLRLTVGVLGIALLALSASLTWRHSAVFKDDLTLFTDNVRKNPEGVAPRDQLGRILVERGEIHAAKAHYEEGVERNPDSATLRFGLAMAAAQLGQIDRAVRLLRETLAIDPNFVGAHHNLAVALGGLGKVEEAERHFQRTFDLDPDSIEARRDFAAYLTKAKRYSEAAEALDRCLELDPEDAPTLYNLGLVLIESKKFEEAILRFEEALDSAPDQAQRIAPHLALAHRSRGLELDAGGNREEAIRHLEKSLEMWPRTAQFRADIASTRSLLEGIASSERGSSPDR